MSRQNSGLFLGPIFKDSVDVNVYWVVEINDIRFHFHFENCVWREVEFLSCSSDRQPEMHSSSSIFGPVVYCAVCTVLMASDVSNELCPNPNNSTDAAGMFKFIYLWFILFLLTDFIILFIDQSNELICCLIIVLVFFFQLSREG